MSGSYYYDAWGNHTVVTESGNNSFEDEIVNNYNPFRYRGYYYDVETGFYYLQSRYYNPEWGRFLNADDYVNANGDILGYNMYVYCGNNPINYSDPCGSCKHRLDFWNDCSDCGGKSFKKKWNEFWDDFDETWDQVKEDVPKLLDQMKNEDGTWSLIDNHRSDPNRVFHEQFFVFERTKGGIGGSFTFGKGTWELEHMDLGLLDFGKAYAEVSHSGIQAGVSVFNPHISIGDVEIGIDFGVGAGRNFRQFKAGWFYIDY